MKEASGKMYCPAQSFAPTLIALEGEGGVKCIYKELHSSPKRSLHP
jgi:hypothetical protein